MQSPRQADPPARQLWHLFTAYWQTQAVYVVAKLGIADLLGNGSRSSDELAALAGADSKRLHRVLRFLASFGLFTQSADQRFGLTPLSELLRTDVAGSMRASALMFAEEQFLAWKELLRSVQTGETAFPHVFGSTYFEYLATHPESARIFNEAMTASRWRAATLATAYDFRDIVSLVDVGGGHGALMAAILAEYPTLRGVLFDLPQVVRDGRQRLQALGVADRCEIVAGDFFDAVPAGGDAYLLSQIIHDWDDEHSLTILRNCRACMRSGSRLLLVERVVREDEGPDDAKGLDLHMMVLLGGQERTEREYRSLLESSGFRLEVVIPMPGGASVIEAIPV